MKISGFTIVRNAVKYNYPAVESIKSILPICDEFIVNVGDSEDGTLELIRSIKSPKIRIIQSQWDMSRRPEVLSIETNRALKECLGDWVFYLQSDEVIHEADLPRLKKVMAHFLRDLTVDALRFKWFHFYGSFWRYRVDTGWYQKQDRIIRNNGQIESFGDAFGFRRIDGKPLRSKFTGCFLYHYGWVHSKETMANRLKNASDIGFAAVRDKKSISVFDYDDVRNFPVYFGTHPFVMKDIVAKHLPSIQDKQNIFRHYFWHPFWLLKLRYKTFIRVKDKKPRMG